MDYADALSKVFLFKDMPLAQRSKLATIAHEYSLPAHERLFDEGDTGDEMYVIVLGTAKVFKKREGGDPEEVATLATGSYFGEMAFLIDAHERTAMVETQERTIALGFKEEELLALCDKDPEVAHYLYRALARGLALRLRNTTRDQAYFKAMALKHD